MKDTGTAMKLTVKKAPTVDRDKLIVRINKEDKPSNVDWWDYIELRVVKSKRAIICELRGDDIKEIDNSDKVKGLIHINDPLRAKLGINPGQKQDFNIKKKCRLFAWCYFVRYHPYDVIKVTIWLAIIAIVLGVVSITIAVL